MFSSGASSTNFSLVAGIDRNSLQLSRSPSLQFRFLTLALSFTVPLYVLAPPSVVQVSTLLYSSLPVEAHFPLLFPVQVRSSLKMA